MLYRDGFLDWRTEHPDKITLGDIFSDEDVWDDVWDIPYIFHGGSKVDELKTITLGQLLSMRTGYSEGWIGSPLDSTLVQDLDQLVAWWHQLYRSGVIESQTCFKCANYLSSTGIVNYIIKEKTKTATNPKGWDPLDYARQTSSTLPNGNIGLFEALGMEQGSYFWEQDLDGVAKAAYGLWADLEDMAKFGQLLLQQGQVMMNGQLKRIVPTEYMTAMTTTQSRMSTSMYPYGWQVWTWGEDNDGDSGYCAEGLGWQSICVFPKDDMVIAIQAPLEWNLDAFFANVGVRNEAIKKIRDGLTCAPTNAPTMSPVSGGNNLGDSNNESNNDSASGNLDFIKEEKEDAPIGLIIALVMALAAICVLASLFFYGKRAKKEDKSVDAFCKVVKDPVFAHGEKVDDIELDDASKASVDTDDESADGTTSHYMIADEIIDDLEQSSSIA